MRGETEPPGQNAYEAGVTPHGIFDKAAFIAKETNNATRAVRRVIEVHFALSLKLVKHSKDERERRSERWIVAYRRYSSDEWSERTFYSKAGATQFKNEYLYDRGPEAQALIRRFIED